MFYSRSLILRGQVAAWKKQNEKEENEKKERDEIISQATKAISDIIISLRPITWETQRLRQLPSQKEVQQYLSQLKTVEAAEQALKEWQRIQVLDTLMKAAKQSDPDEVSVLQLIAYTTDSVLTIDASLDQKRMEHRAKILGMVGALIIAAIPFALGALAFTHGSALSVVVELTMVLLSKIEGIEGFFTAMKTSNGACRKPLREIKEVKDPLLKRKDLSPPQQCIIEIMKFCDNKEEDVFRAHTLLLHTASKMMDDAKIDGDIYNDFTSIQSAVNELLKAKEGAAQDQAEWTQLLPYLLRFSQNPNDSVAVNNLDQKAKEIWNKAQARQDQNAAKRIAKIMLIASLILTTACIATVFVAMAFFGATITSSTVVSAHLLIYLSKAMFWTSSLPVARGTDYCQNKLTGDSDKPIDVTNVKIDKLTPLQAICFYSKRMCDKAKQNGNASSIPANKRLALSL